MGLLDRASILWGVAVAVVLAIISAVVAPLSVTKLPLNCHVCVIETS